MFTIIRSQPSSAVSITAAENYALYAQHACFSFFFKAWGVLSWYTVLCICAQNPTASTAGWVYSGPEAALLHKLLFWPTWNSLYSWKKLLIWSIGRERPSTCMDNEEGVRWGTATPLRTPFIHLLLPLCQNSCVMAVVPQPPALQSSPRALRMGKGRKTTALLPRGWLWDALLNNKVGLRLCVGFVLVLFAFFKWGQKPGLHRTVLKDTLQTDPVFRGASSRKEKLCGTSGLR